ncbi:hypothetical protein D3C77_766370 [compost metagenome]
MTNFREAAVAYFFGILITRITNDGADIGVAFDESRYRIRTQAQQVFGYQYLTITSR